MKLGIHGAAGIGAGKGAVGPVNAQERIDGAELGEGGIYCGPGLLRLGVYSD
ncbi:MAG: hypothetical protein MK293_14360 [Pedosphaera sp.]|nr:hypothetical protein [Pedosphaera sp.]